MKTILVLFFSCFCALGSGQNNYTDNIFNENIKTVEFYPVGDRMGEPVLFLNEESKLILSFDDLDSDYKNFAFTLIHCDAFWNPSDIFQNEYLEGYTESFIEDYSYSKNTKIPYIHYWMQIPNRNIQITKSGNYIVKIYQNGDSDNPVITKRFYVVDPLCTIGGKVIAASNPEKRDTDQEINFKVNIANLNSRFPSREIITQIQQNGRTDNQINKLQPLAINDGILDFNLQRENVFPGLNTFRFFDFSSLSYNSEYVYSIDRTHSIDEVELILSKPRKNSPYKNEPTQFGKFLIDTKSYNDEDTESEYALVKFLLSTSEPNIDSDIFITGGFDLWRHSIKMDFDFSSQLYYANVLLKQGFYSYQYAKKNKKNNFFDVSSIEGSFFQTPNSYFIRVYFRSPGTTYDQLVGWQEIRNYIE